MIVSCWCSPLFHKVCSVLDLFVFFKFSLFCSQPGTVSASGVWRQNRLLKAFCWSLCPLSTHSHFYPINLAIILNLHFFPIFSSLFLPYPDAPPSIHLFFSISFSTSLVHPDWSLLPATVLWPLLILFSRPPSLIPGHDSFLPLAITFLLHSLLNVHSPTPSLSLSAG